MLPASPSRPAAVACDNTDSKPVDHLQTYVLSFQRRDGTIASVEQQRTRLTPCSTACPSSFGRNSSRLTIAISGYTADVVRGRGAAKVRRELLVGFDPVAHYGALLQARFGEVAALFWDGWGGRAIAIKWRPEALRPVGTDHPCLRSRMRRQIGLLPETGIYAYHTGWVGDTASSSGPSKLHPLVWPLMCYGTRTK